MSLLNQNDKYDLLIFVGFVVGFAIGAFATALIGGIF